MMMSLQKKRVKGGEEMGQQDKEGRGREGGMEGGRECELVITCISDL